MKKAMAWTLAILLLACMAGGGAEETAGGENARCGVFDLYDMNGETAEWRGVGIPLFQGLLILPEAILPENREDLTLADDQGLWEAEDIVSMEENHVAFIAFDAETNPPRYSPFPLLTLTGMPDINILYVYDTDAAGDRIYRTVSALSPLTWEGMDCMTVTLSGSARPGDPILTEGNELAGMILAEYSEGLNRYVALTPLGIYSLILKISGLSDVPGEKIAPPEGFTVSVDRNLVIYDWSGITLVPEEGKELYLVVSDAENDYINYGPAGMDQPRGSMLLTPGRTYLSGLLESAGPPDELPAGVVITELPEAEKLTEYGFTPVMTALVRLETGNLVPGETPEALKSFTEEEIRAGNLYFYSHSTYDVEERTEDTLLISMETPDGMDYRYVSGWIYDPSYEAEDAWATSLEDLGFRSVLENKGYMSGEYRISYYVGGALGDSFSFEIR